MKNIIVTRDKMIVWHVIDATERNFELVDQVLVLATSKPNEMSLGWVRPGKIESKICETNCILSVAGWREKQFYHVRETVESIPHTERSSKERDQAYTRTKYNKGRGSNINSPMILVEAPGENPRLCIDCRKLNAIMKAEFFPLPSIKEKSRKYQPPSI